MKQDPTPTVLPPELDSVCESYHPAEEPTSVERIWLILGTIVVLSVIYEVAINL